MTALLPRPYGGNAVKGLAKSGNHLRHAAGGKSVDVNPSISEGGYSPMTAKTVPNLTYQSQGSMSNWTIPARDVVKKFGA